MDRCSCPGAPRAKDIYRTTKEESENHKKLVVEAIDEVVERQPSGRDEILQAAEEAFQRRRIEFSKIERDYVPDVVQSRLAARPMKELLAFKALGGLGVNLVREIRRLISEDRHLTADDD
jgi:hypothetical protein